MNICHAAILVLSVKARAKIDTSNLKSYRMAGGVGAATLSPWSLHWLAGMTKLAACPPIHYQTRVTAQDMLHILARQLWCVRVPGCGEPQGLLAPR